MKKLDTLVDDIYKKLSVLGEGKSLELSDKVTDMEKRLEGIETILADMLEVFLDGMVEE